MKKYSKYHKDNACQSPAPHFKLCLLNLSQVASLSIKRLDCSTIYPLKSADRLQELCPVTEYLLERAECAAFFFFFFLSVQPQPDLFVLAEHVIY